VLVAGASKNVAALMTHGLRPPWARFRSGIAAAVKYASSKLGTAPAGL